MKKRSPIIIIVLAVFIGMAVMVLLNNIVKPKPVVVAAFPIAPGTVLSEELLEVRTIPAGGIPVDAFSEITELLGKTVAVGRAEGDIIVASILGDDASAGIPSQLAEGHIAIAVDVDRASAVAGILRAGQTVTLIGMLSPDIMTNQAGLAYSAAQSIVTDDGSIEVIQGQNTKTTPTPAPVLGPLGRITITGVKVLLVPQNFQYEETAYTANQEEMFASSQAMVEEESVIVLDVPTTPIEITPGVFVNPATLIATLNQYGYLYLALEGSTGISVSPENNLTINLAELYNLINATTTGSDAAK
jgi:Flp pilus assembly protein CpaB